LRPFRIYSRLVANESTTIFDQAILFNGYSVGAGKNQMYAVPGSDAFEISINTL